MAPPRDPLTLRSIEPRDEADWRRLWAAYLAFYETTVPEEVYRTSFDRLVSGGANEYRGVLALRGDRPVGLAHFLFHRHMWRVEGTCYLQDLFVEPAARGSGAGRALIEAVYAEADREGSPSVYWMTQEFNATARHLYDRVARKTPFIKYARDIGE